ncbi:UNVERIFIED_ORG: tRNA (adenosine(37)-N6)-threonylcarbamoyltransferase complex dimerization subunit type 1 TsaB [Clostridium botulinum]|uniref:tRNA (adenosine(37)-N6)-threonylcarbamoyltransferase complex dimerization subunit type 1 TsaB n=1 Tax=Clostridium botulinum TaxID=1491 RepID=UPI000A16EA01|nr:tRNA (adenosine(37)-N6)-threonylcarbamoyltransferase complex dimerization subunit type 1 TsaB [Clostridium botulinum]MBN1040933.1 tRNA (adenosine(37)-N6)-threonylcarbamoyltransferase complex dimerization subunit type 1 TsaB [Clostridium botulinum]MBN1076521.1 tRNA (adenosine(37)-N6)-threonylcarbamoyltransferase complex dimerization subunit type 1 TsaB [Clostridium botulinum]MBY6836674.1 tRNA (adenosine(37)-N6)-threonylcarbamoyltransferase complex dimerization subunit type 1 TsaB [Clostridium 
MILLSIDSSSKVATAALFEDDTLLGEVTLNNKKEHSTILMTLVESLLDSCNLDIDSVDGFVVSKGPGSFTGLRIGMATIKGLSFGSNKPYVSISSLDALAYSIAPFNGIICPVMDALRNNVYTALYKSCNGKLEKIMDYSALDINELIDMLNEKEENVMFIGDGLNNTKEYILNNCNNCFFPPNHLNLVRASSLGELGMIKLKNGEYDDSNSAPFYLKKPQAEREYEKRMKLKSEAND